MHNPRSSEKRLKDILAFPQRSRSFSALMKHVGAAFTNLAPEQERDPPPEPTPVTFPHHAARKMTTWDPPSEPPDLQQLFAKMLKPSDVSESHLAALNIEILPPCSIDELVPLASNGTSYLPPLLPDQAVDAASYSSAIKADPIAAKKRKDLDDRLAELRTSNDDGFRVITKSFKAEAGKKAPKLAYMRKFWEGLESMSQYWDCSLDDYYEAPDSPMAQLDANRDAKRARLESVTVSAYQGEGIATSGNHQNGDGADTGQHQSQTASNNALPNGYGEAASGHLAMPSPSLTPPPRTRIRYKGRRTSTGRLLPDNFRSQTIIAFVEGAVWPFGASVQPPRRMPLVQLNKLNLPVRQTAMVYSMPKERTRARSGWLEGPIMDIQVRGETDFLDDYGNVLESKARLDVMREIGGLLQVAQERRREGRTETKPGEGKWWTTKPRWGGGPGGGIGEEDGGNDDIASAAEELLNATKNERRVSGKEKKRRTAALLWKELKCGGGNWDPKTEYAAIGKAADSQYDEVFMISSLNHHISILKLTVHGTYLDYLTSVALPKSIPDEAEWCRPRLQRSKWFDLFDVQQRVDVFRTLWGVMGYLMRDVEVASS